jgi:hypothetical protein
VEVLCESCGAANPPGVEFCMFCGTYLEWSKSVVDTRTSPAVRPQEGAPTEPRPTAARPPGPPGAADEEPVVIPSLRTSAPVLEASPAVGAAPPRPTFTTAAPTPEASTCPACGRRNDPGLHFCARCGQALGAEPAAAQTQGTAWSRMMEDRDRQARRAYRRSLPPLYRWRRVVIGVLVPLLVLGGLVAVGRHPVRWVQDRWWDLRGATVAVSGISATTSPANASAAGADPASLVDGTEQAWSEPWNPQTEGDSCGGAPGTGTVVLTFPPTRVREVDVNAGLAASNAKRPLEFRPQAVGVRFDSGPCRRFTLVDSPDLQRLQVDSQVPVTSVSIGVDTTYPARSDGARALSLTEVGLRSRPS